MDASVDYRFVFDEDHMLTGYAHYVRQSGLHSALKWSRYLALPLIACFMVWLVDRGDTTYWPFCGLIAVLLVTQGVTVRAGMRSRLRKSPFRDQQLDVQMAASGLQTQMAGAETRIDWNLVTKAVAYRDGLLVFHGPHAYRWLPDAALVHGSRAEAREFVRANASHFVEFEPAN